MRSVYQRQRLGTVVNWNLSSQRRWRQMPLDFFVPVTYVVQWDGDLYSDDGTPEDSLELA